MLRKKKVLALVGIVCVMTAFLSVVYVAASPAWDIDDMVAWMENRGSVYIPRITRWTREIREKMGQGLVGEMVEGSVNTKLGQWVIVFTYIPPHPKKVSLYIDVADSAWKGDSIVVSRKVQMHGAWRDLDPFYWENVAPPAKVPNAFLILDQLPVSTWMTVAVYQTAGLPFTLWWQAIIEEV